MIDYRLWSRRLVLALMGIAAVVFVGQVLRQNVWWLVSIYWLVLTSKNWCDWRQGQ
jgi:hypothetical protein